MAITNGYATQAEVESRFQSTTNAWDTEIDAAVESASRAIDAWCGRRFYVDGSATAREYGPESVHVDGLGRTWVDVDDISSTTGLVVATDTSDDGTFDTTWAAADYQTEPRNGVVDGVEGWPITRIVAVESRTFPLLGKRSRVEITADWGWASVPTEVKEACLILSGRLLRRKDTPDGLAGGGEFGVVRIDGRMDPDAVQLLRPFRKGAL